MQIDWRAFLNKTRLRDGAVFLAVTLILVFLLNYTVLVFMPMNFKRLVLSLAIFGQFYLVGFVSLPVRHKVLKRTIYVIIFTLNYFIFREVILAFIPKSVIRLFNMEVIIALVFLFSLLTRGIRMYYRLREQLMLLNFWTQRKILFEKPAELTLNLGRDGNMIIHPNELVYIRTKASGDHTKVFGIKPRQPKGVSSRLSEFETSTYRNFDQVQDLLQDFSQFKKIHYGAIINTTYPFKTVDGILNIEGRRFKVSTIKTL